MSGSFGLTLYMSCHVLLMERSDRNYFPSPVRFLRKIIRVFLFYAGKPVIFIKVAVVESCVRLMLRRI